MKFLFICLAILHSFTSESQKITPDNLFYLWGQKNNEENIINFIEKKGYDYFETKEEDGYIQTIYTFGRGASIGLKVVYIYIKDDNIEFLEYQTSSKSEYVIYKEYLKTKGYKITLTTPLDSGPLMRVYKNGKIKIMLFEKSLEPSGMQYHISIATEK